MQRLPKGLSKIFYSIFHIYRQPLYFCPMLKYLFPFILLLAGCREVWQSKPYAIKDGHERMIAILDSIAYYADPLECYNLNSKYVEIIRKELKKLPNDELPLARTRFAEQLIYAGKPGQAIIELTTLTHDQGDSITEANKEMYEFLALAYLRLGEVNNCVERHNAESCIVPIQPDGYYTDMIGLKNAIKVYQRLLESFPDDSQNRWLLNIAYMNQGQYPDSVPEAWRIDPRVFKSPTNSIKFTNQAVKLGIDLNGISGGVCMDDFDNDGDLDLFITRYGLRDQCRYFVNEKGKFKDRTDAAHLTGIVSGINTIQADYDNDGDPDILILRGGWLKGGTHPNSLLRNNGNNTFTDVTIEAGLLSFHPTQTADWADYDSDGWLDLYIANESHDSSGIHPNELYRNNGNGTFTNMAQVVGLNLVGFYKAAVWGDINNDRRPDLYLSSMSGDNKLFANRGSDNNGKWIFEDISAKAGVTHPQRSFPAWFFDYNNDGLEDILTIGFDLDPTRRVAGEVLEDLLDSVTTDDCLRLYRNNGNETFTDVHKAAGLHHITYAMGHNFGDFDNDGWLDFYLGTGTPDLRALIPNRMFRNVGGTHFEEISMGGVAHLQKGHGVATGDIDNDGDTDIYTVMGGAYEGDLANNVYFQNPGNTNHWLQLDLRGRHSNRDALGAKVAVTIVTTEGKKRTIWATCGTGGSFGGGSRRVEMGLGNAAKIEKVAVFWPKMGAGKAELKGVGLDTRVFIEEE
jgi:hypothetical protein